MMVFFYFRKDKRSVTPTFVAQRHEGNDTVRSLTMQ